MNRAKGPSYLPMMYTILPIKIGIYIPAAVTSNTCFYFFPFRVAFSNFEYPNGALMGGGGDKHSINFRCVRTS